MAYSRQKGKSALVLHSEEEPSSKNQHISVGIGRGTEKKGSGPEVNPFACRKTGRGQLTPTGVQAGAQQGGDRKATNQKKRPPPSPTLGTFARGGEKPPPSEWETHQTLTRFPMGETQFKKPFCNGTQQWGRTFRVHRPLFQADGGRMGKKKPSHYGNQWHSK